MKCWFLIHDEHGIIDIYAPTLEDAKRKAITFFGGKPEEYKERF